VFSDDHGTSAWKPNRATKAFLRHRRNAGLRPFRLHDLRHFMATEMLRKIMQTPAPIPEQDHDRVQRDRSLPDPRALPTRVASVLADGN
jgi:integrase